MPLDLGELVSEVLRGDAPCLAVHEVVRGGDGFHGASGEGDAVGAVVGVVPASLDAARDDVAEHACGGACGLRAKRWPLEFE